MQSEEIIFVPDRNLALHVAQQVPEKKIIPWAGFCYVHQRFSVDEIKSARQNYPDAEVIAHPECTPEVVKLADAVCSTGQMIDYVKKSPAATFIVLTEVGMIERLKIEFRRKNFLTMAKVCLQMKKNTLTAIRDSLIREQYRIHVPPEAGRKAKVALERMIQHA